jgi:hypothetical protein
MDQSNRLLIAGVVLFGSAVIARRYQSDGIGISPDDLPEEGEIRRSSWKSKARGDAPYTETVTVMGRRSPITKTMFDKEPELPLDEQKRLANERGARLAKEAAEDEVVVTTRGVRVALPPPTYEEYGDPDSIILKYIRRAEESQVGKPEDYLIPNREEQRIISINQNRRAESMKLKIAQGTRRETVSSEAINESCLNRIPKMVRIRKLLDRPELLEPGVASELKARWVKFQAQCIKDIPTVMNRYLHFNPR